MVIPLLASGLLEGPLSADASLLSKLSDVSGFSFLLSGASESDEPDPDSSGDEALLAQFALRDPSVRAAVLREIDRRLSVGFPADTATTARLERLLHLLRRLDSEGPANAPSGAAPEESEPDLFGGSSPPPPRAPADPFSAGRVLYVVAKDIPVAPRALSSAAPSVGAEANAELVDRVLRAARLVRARGISRLRLTLKPPELGEIRVDLTLRGKVVRATFQADAPGAAEALRSRMSELKCALEKRGLQVGELSVLSAGAERGTPFLPPAPSASVPGNLDLKA